MKRLPSIATLSRDMGSPDFSKRAQLPLVQIPVPSAVAAGFTPGTPVRCYRLGECSVIDSVRPDGRRQISVAHPSRYPTWDEIAEARYRVLPRIAFMALVLPPKAHYVNLHPNCFQLVQVEPVADC